MASDADGSLDFEVRRDDYRRSRVIPGPAPRAEELESDAALLRVDRFAFTANNVTYAVAGDLMSYWSFFPAAEKGWGRIPVWGFADVLASRHPEVREGERLFGYLPMSTHLVIRPDRVTPGRLVDASPHREGLPPVYNQYTRVAADPLYDARREHWQMLFWPLFTTAFLLDDLLLEEEYAGARTVLLTSASSKTALGLAFLLSEARRPVETLGLTSPGNRRFVEGLGCYDRVLAYDALESLPEERPVVLVDMAGHAGVVARVHRHFGEGVKASLQVGLTHWEAGAGGGPGAAPLPGAEPTFFFAPTRVEKRTRDWGAEGFQERLGAAWHRFRDAASAWIRPVSGAGPETVTRVVRDTVEGRARPDEGHVLTLWPRAAGDA